ncbi:MAG TPA: hypothetical protein DCO75_05785 [Fibrobacteres bacterium]|jgi:hypothetical protein|nr:hypothetical protein [Fibrobacterota bacterium]
MDEKEKKFDMNSVFTNANLLESLRAEIEEIEKFKWYLGERLGHDPLQDRSMNDICQEWITNYAADFRKQWQEERRKNQKQG